MNSRLSQSKRSTRNIHKTFIKENPIIYVNLKLDSEYSTVIPGQRAFIDEEIQKQAHLCHLIKRQYKMTNTNISSLNSLVQYCNKHNYLIKIRDKYGDDWIDLNFPYEGILDICKKLNNK